MYNFVYAKICFPNSTVSNAVKQRKYTCLILFDCKFSSHVDVCLMLL